MNLDNKESEYPLRQRIINLYQTYKRENGESLALRYEGVAARLCTEEDETRDTLWELVHDKIMFMSSGYFALNPSNLWEKEK